ncbi:Phosphomethylpyrimidine kinase-domain-containing protein [Boletus edulis BED1]|uniref:Phosphomethylpyrimidine kinase-domain-containing protein n=1 Tax=Boletus edulis BED1 TaxID=1328754 RepID=A0AAD4BQX3_BOLED|nr:Phosphomethylpyrimidine kinase-domain-containing protein [Boletus edulis BED1]
MLTKVTAVLTVAGSDSSGGAGIQADLRTFAAHGCYGTTVVTALTAQNTIGVQAVHGSPPDFVIRSVLDDIDVRTIKTGMLFSAEITQAVASTLREYIDADVDTRGRVPVVCDPVCVSTSGHVLLQPDAVDMLIQELFPLACVITPNQAEAELLLKHRSLPCPQHLLSLGPAAVFLKGGHVNVSQEEMRELQIPEGITLDIRPAFLLEEHMEILSKHAKMARVADLVVDVLCQRGVKTITLYPRPRLQSNSTHGTGCTLSAALACALGNGTSVEDATAQATLYTYLGIETAPPIGKGYGPLNHLHSISRLVVQPRTDGHPYPLTHKFIQSTVDLWKSYVQHDFVVQLGKGTLDRASFIHFIKQDYHYLKYYSRAYALLATKSHDFAPISSAAKVMQHIADEKTMHVSYCAQFGITLEELETTPESPATMAYGAFLIDVGLQGDTTKLLVALAACLLGYGEVGLWLEKEAAKPDAWVKREGNPYREWMEDYAGEAYQGAVSVGLETIEARAAADPPSPVRYAEWLAVWERCVRLEKQFWDMGMNLS